jgi:hypothetical protein
MLTFDNTKVTSIHSDTKIYLAPDLFISTDVLKSDKIDESMIGFDYNHILSNVSESEKLINNIKYVTTFVKDELIPFLEKLN